MSVQTENHPQRGQQPRWSVLEIVGVVLALLGFGGFFARFGGGPVSWDELWYMDQSLFPTPDPEILNRYFHIYAQKIFFGLSGGDPFRGALYFWIFLIGATSLLVYLTARRLYPTNTPLNALIAGLIFFTSPWIINLPGVSYADYTVMFLAMLMVYLFIVDLQSERRSPWLLAGMGLIFFFLFKTKESGIPFGVLFLGLGFEKDGRYHWKRLLQRALPVVGGFLAGILLFFALDGIFLHDPWFGVRLENWQALLRFNTRGEIARLEENWVGNAVNSGSILLYLLAALSLWLRRDETPPALRMLWLLPLAVIVFLTMTLIQGSWNVIPRYMIPITPLLAVLAAQCYRPFKWTTSAKKSHWVELIIFSVCVLGVIATILLFDNHWVSLGWVPGIYWNTIVLPILACLFLVVWILIRQPSRMAQAALVLILAVQCFNPTFAYDIKHEFQRQTQKTVDYRFYPLHAFGDQISYTPQMQMFVSSSLRNDHSMFTRDSATSKYFFDLWYRVQAREDQFTWADFNASLLLSQNFDYAFAGKEDWDACDAQTQSLLKDRYTVQMDPQGIVFFKTR